MGIFIYQVKYNREIPIKEKYDYSTEDSLYKRALISIAKSQSEINEKFIASEHKLSDFSKHKIRKAKSKNFKFEIVSINSAGVKTLTKIPGIGIKTAQKIVEFRNLNGKFKTVDDLIKIKGIGKIKLNKIRKYIKLD